MLLKSYSWPARKTRTGCDRMSLATRGVAEMDAFQHAAITTNIFAESAEGVYA
jgi:hypothetical protein